MKITVKIFIVFFVLSVFSTTVCAETIELKSGKIRKGKIVERTDKFIKIDIGIGVPITYYLDEIEKIDDAEISKSKDVLLSSASDSEGEIFVNEEYGFEIRGPKGWFKQLVAEAPDVLEGGVMFHKHARPIGETTLPSLGVTIDIAPQNIMNAVDFSQSTLRIWEDTLAKYKSGTLEVIEKPHEIEINGIKGAKTIFQINSTDGKAMRNLDYKFMKDNIIISVMGLDWPDNFETNRREFEKAVQSFKFIATVSSSSEEGVRIYNKQGFQIIWPKDWVELKRQKQGDSFAFFKKKDPSEKRMSGFLLSLFQTNKDIMAIATEQFNYMKSYDPTVEGVELPHEFEINGLKGARCLVEQPLKDPEGKIAFWQSILYMFFINGDTLFQFTLSTPKEEYQDDYAKIEKSLSSLRFISR